MPGIPTSQPELTKHVEAKHVTFTKDALLQIDLSDGRMITIPYNQIPWLDWLAQATPEQQNNWSIEPGGYAIYWENLDNGLEIAHLLGIQPLV